MRGQAPPIKSGPGWPLLAAALFAAALLYLPARNMGFFFDDKVTILQNVLIQSDRLVDVLSENPFRAAVNVTFSFQYHRATPEFPIYARNLYLNQAHLGRKYIASEDRVQPVYNDPLTGKATQVSLDLDRGLIFPVPDAFPFRLANLFMHLFNSLLLFFIVRKLSGSSRIAALSASLFALHPLATEPVDYISARFTLMAIGFSMASLLAHLRADDNPKSDWAAAAFFLLALLSKETAAVLPAIVFLIDYARGRPQPRVLLALVLSAVYFGLRMLWLVVPGSSTIEAMSWYKYLLTEQRVFWIYLAKIFVPLHLNFDYNIVYRPVMDPAVAAINLALLALAALAVLKGFKAPPPDNNKKAKQETMDPHSPIKWPAALFLCAWISLAPTSSFIALADPIKEDRAYALLALLIPGIVSLLAAALKPASGKPKDTAKARKIAYACAFLSMLWLGALTYNRNLDWSSDYAMSRDTVMKSPGKARADYNYATALKWREDVEGSLLWFHRTLEIDPDHTMARQNYEVLKKIQENGAGERLMPPKDKPSGN